jgi:hypothetical protein
VTAAEGRSSATALSLNVEPRDAGVALLELPELGAEGGTLAHQAEGLRALGWIAALGT